MEKVVAPVLFCSIGGLTFQLESEGPPLLQEIEGPYRQFFSDPPAASRADRIQVRIGINPAAVPAGRPIFDGEAAWSLFADGDERVLVYRPPVYPEPLSVARFLRGSRAVALSCSPRALAVEHGVSVCRSPFRYPLDQLLTMYFLGSSGLIVHAAGIATGQGAVAFAGVSGAGKSTISRLVAGRSGFVPLSDDRVILGVREGRAALYGTPWPGEAQVAENRCEKLRWLFFLEQGAVNAIRPLKTAASLPRLLRTASLPWFDKESLDTGFAACATLLDSVPAAVFTFRAESFAVDMLERFLAAET